MYDLNAMNPLSHITGVILCGGRSRRMGSDKALLRLHNRKVIEHVTDSVTAACQTVLIVAQPHQDFSFLSIPVVHDIASGYGALMGVYTGLIRAATQRILAVACDMPFVRPEVLRYLASAAPNADVVVPKIKGNLEPLLAVYSRSCIAPIEKMLRSGEKCVYAFYPEMRVREIDQDELFALDPELESFINLNTPEQFSRINGQQP